jgi:hypothetical protein
MSQHPEEPQLAHADLEVLRAYATNQQTAEAAALHHIARCPQCLSEVAHLRSQMQVQVQPSDVAEAHPMWLSAEVLEAYALGELTGARRREVERHLRTCLRCAAEVAVSREFLLEDVAVSQGAGESILPTIADAVSDTVRRVFASLLPGPSTQLNYQPAINTRGSTPQDTENTRDGASSPPANGSQVSSDSESTSWAAEAQPRIYGAEGVEVSLRPRLERGKYILTGSVSVGAGASVGDPIAARLVSTSAASEGGEQAAPIEVRIEYDAFELGPMPPGTYTVEILFADRLLEIAALDLQAS